MSLDGLNNFLESLTKAASASTDEASESNKRRKMSSPNDPATTSTSDPAPGFGFVEINRLEHCTRVIQKNIRVLLDSYPSYPELLAYTKNPKVDDFVKQEILNNELLHLGAQLKTLHAAKKLPLLDDILNNKIDVSKHEQSILGSADAELPPKAEPQPLAPRGENKHEADGLPPLPEIKDPQLKARVFQHKSTSANKTYLKESEIVLAHNERIEFLGDAILNTIASVIVYEKFPYANEGQLSQIRASLVNNKTLAEVSLAYGFDNHLRCNINEISLRTGSQKIYADVFEAYIGALAVERGYDLQDLHDWLAQLMRTKLSEAEMDLKKVVPLNKNAKTELYSLVGSASSHPIYKVVENGNGLRNPYRVHCIMEDDLLGEGVAPGLKDAGLRAAMSALENKAMLEKYGKKRLETHRSLSMVSQEAGGAASLDSRFPFVADKTVYPNKSAMNEVYAYFGKYLGVSPEYTVAIDADSKQYRVELKVRETVIAVAQDVSKKNAMARAASVVLNNKTHLNELINYIT